MIVVQATQLYGQVHTVYTLYGPSMRNPMPTAENPDSPQYQTV
jgi:hypothetical protein